MQKVSGLARKGKGGLGHEKEGKKGTLFSFPSYQQEALAGSFGDSGKNLFD